MSAQALFKQKGMGQDSCLRKIHVHTHVVQNYYPVHSFNTSNCLLISKTDSPGFPAEPRTGTADIFREVEPLSTSEREVLFEWRVESNVLLSQQTATVNTAASNYTSSVRNIVIHLIYVIKVN